MKKAFYFFKTSAFAFSALFVFYSCANNSKDNTTTEDTTDTTAVEEAPAPQVTDPQIASIAVTANQIDIDFAKAALEKLDNADAKGFANMMVSDHNSVIDAAVKLAGELGVTPEDNPISQSLVARRDSTIGAWKNLSGANFNKAYIDNEVTYHEFAIGAVKDLLIPNASNEQLKSLLESAVPNFEAHLAKAKEIQAGLE
ncbi:MAG: DUF4142 domain-containing protein [Chitinophagales bacterium]|nr:DUF4142 domain-containing protein [Chitinophagales bacterium]